MVRIINYKERQNENGETFFVLELQGGVEMVLSQTTGNYYASVKKAQVTSTFDEQTCKALIGTEIEGEIIKKECEPYDYTNKETGEIISLTHRWIYQPREEKQVPEQVSNYTDMQQYQGNMARA